MVAPSMRLLTKRWKSMTMEKEQETQEQNHVQMSQEMIHHHHDHEKYDQVHFHQGRSCAAIQFDTLSVSELVRGVCGIEKKERPLSLGSATTNGR